MQRLFEKPWFNNVRKDGNCAVSSFGGHLFFADFIHAVEQSLMLSGEEPNRAFKEFIDLVCEQNPEAIQEKSWEAVRDYLVELNQSNPDAFQIMIAPCLRSLFCQLALTDPQHFERTLEPLQSAYQYYVDSTKLKIKLRKHASDDIFIDHGNIRKKFDDIYAAHPQQYDEYKQLKTTMPRTAIQNEKLSLLEEQLFREQKNKVVKWWQDEGYHTFLQQMEDNRLRKWAGDLELYLLARYFHVNLMINVRNSIPYDVYRNHGSVSKNETDYTQDDVAELVNRGIIDRPYPQDSDYHFLAIDEVELDSRLKQLPDYETVALYITESTQETTLKGKSVPEEWSAACLQQLSARDIIVSHDNGRSFVFNLPANEALLRMAEVDNKDKILASWQLHSREYPTMTIYHDRGHYEYDRPAIVPQHPLPQEVSEEDQPIDPPIDPENHIVRDVTQQWLEQDRFEPNVERWNENTKQVLTAIDKKLLESGEWLEYSFFDAKEVGLESDKDKGYVTRAEQIALDAEFAKALQKKR